MKASTIATIAALAVSASAQLGALPPCGTTCVIGNINPRCLADIPCNCRDAEHQAVIAQCIQRTCTDPATAAQAVAAGAGICREAGITISVPGATTTSTSTTVSTTSSTSSSVSTTTSTSTSVSTTVRTTTSTTTTPIVSGTGGSLPTNGTGTGTPRPTPTPTPTPTGGDQPSSGNQLIASSLFGALAAFVAFVL